MELPRDFLPPELLDLEKQKLTLEVDALRRRQRDETLSSYRRRVVDFVGEVNEIRCHTTMEGISRLAAESADPITLRIDSQGGTCSDGLALYDFIQLIRSEGVVVNTQAFGLCASMAVIVLQAGETRTVARRCRNLIHEVSSVAYGTVSEMLEQSSETRNVQNVLLDILLERSSMSRQSLRRKWKKTDWWLSAEEMVALGFADAVL